MKRKTIIGLVAAILISIASGCSQTASEEPVDTAASAASPKAASAQVSETPSEAVEDSNDDSSKIQMLSDTTETLTCWTSTLRSLESTTKSMNDLSFIQEFERLTNVHIEWQQASSTAASEKFQLMIAGGAYTDIVYDLSSYYSGGITKALEDNVIVSLDDYIEDNAPNYMSVINYSDEYSKEALTDDGQHLAIYSYYDVTADDYYPMTGPMIRKDWLDELGLSVPVTYDDYYNVALAFKNSYNCTNPIMMLSNSLFYSGYFTGGLGTSGFDSTGTGAATIGLYQSGQTVHSSLLEQGYYDYLEKLNAWYKEGIIGSDFLSNPTSLMSDDYKNHVYNDDTGIFAETRQTCQASRKRP